jgi:hypothetical protein
VATTEPGDDEITTATATATEPEGDADGVGALGQALMDALREASGGDDRERG